MAKKLNWPMILTFILDYLWVGIVYSFYFWINLNNMTFSSVFLTFSLGFVSLYLRESINFYFFANNISKAKLNYKFTFEDYFDTIKLYFQYLIVFWLGAQIDLFHCRYTDFYSTYLEITVQYWGMTLLKDFTTMKFLHPWMHKPKNYWIHAHHHKIGIELNAFHTYRIDFIDAFIENLIGPFLYVLSQYIFGGKLEVHFIAFLFTAWADTFVHSVNPYCIIHFNPILEYWCKPNLEHNLHHIFSGRLLYA